MKDFVLDLTYNEATIVNSNDDITTIPLSNLPNTNITHHAISLDKTNSTHSTNNSKSNKFNIYNLIDYL